MNWKLIAHAAWHGIGAGLIAAGTAVATYRSVPQGWDAVILAVGIGIAIWKGADAYIRVPSDV